MKQNTGSGSYSISKRTYLQSTILISKQKCYWWEHPESPPTAHSAAQSSTSKPVRFKCVLHFSRCYNSDGTSICVKIETCFFFPFWNLNSHMDHASFNQHTLRNHSWGTEGDHSPVLLTPHTVFSQRIHTCLIHAGKQEGERPLSQSCCSKCRSDWLDHDCHSSHWKGEVWFVSCNLQTQHCRAEHHNTLPGVPSLLVSCLDSSSTVPASLWSTSSQERTLLPSWASQCELHRLFSHCTVRHKAKEKKFHVSCMEKEDKRLFWVTKAWHFKVMDLWSV